MKTLLRSFVLTALFVSSASTVFAGELKLALNNGRVTLVAQDVPLRQILDEWARVGKTKIVNGDKLSGPTVTLQLVDVPEAQALETLLRTAAGYVVAQRAEYVPGTSVFDRVMILPTSRPPATSASAPAPTFNQPARPMPQPMPDDDDPADAPVVMPPGMQQPPNGIQPPAGAMPQGMQPNPQQPLTAPRPGMLPQPTTPQQPGTSPTPGIRPPGGPGGGPGGEGA